MPLPRVTASEPDIGCHGLWAQRVDVLRVGCAPNLSVPDWAPVPFDDGAGAELVPQRLEHMLAEAPQSRDRLGGNVRPVVAVELREPEAARQAMRGAAPRHGFILGAFCLARPLLERSPSLVVELLGGLRVELVLLLGLQPRGRLELFDPLGLAGLNNFLARRLLCHSPSSIFRDHTGRALQKPSSG